MFGFTIKQQIKFV